MQPRKLKVAPPPKTPPASPFLAGNYAPVPYGFHGAWLSAAVLREPKAGRKGPG